MRLLSPLVLLVLPGVSRAADPAPVVPEARESIERGLTFLADDSLLWKENRKCASCHHAPMTLWALNEAKRAGYKVNDKAMTEITTWAIAKDDPAKILVANQAKATAKLVRQAPLQMILGLGAGDGKDPTVRAWVTKAVAALAEDQLEDGAWQLGDGRLPLIASKEVMTTQVLLAFTTAVVEPKETLATREKAIKWLAASATGDDLQTVALRLILARRLGKPAGETDPLVKTIRSRQNADGGWSQTKELASDAFATGQVLYALAEAGVKPDDPAIGKAHIFLVKKQRRDGSWPMDSRPMKPGGEAAKNVDPITHAGSAWAVMGLVRTTPPAKQP